MSPSTARSEPRRAATCVTTKYEDHDGVVLDIATGWYVTPTSVKAVVLDDAGQVLLGLNPRGSYELPGGWPEPGDGALEETARREVAEESGLDVDVGALVTACLHRADENTPPVVLVVFAAHAGAQPAPVTSNEHTRMAFFPTHALPHPLAATYRHAIMLATSPKSATAVEG